jgi:hypothetical protein
VRWPRTQSVCVNWRLNFQALIAPLQLRVPLILFDGIPMKLNCLFAAILLSLSVAGCDRAASPDVTAADSPSAPQAVQETVVPAVVETSDQVSSPAGGDKAVALAVKPGQAVSGTYTLGRDGVLQGLGIWVGNYRNAADGSVTLSLCLTGDCQDATLAMAGTKDNSYLIFPLDNPVPVTTGQVLEYKLGYGSDATKRVAVWSFKAKADSATLIGVDGVDTKRAPKLSLHFQK